MSCNLRQIKFVLLLKNHKFNLGLLFVSCLRPIGKYLLIIDVTFADEGLHNSRPRFGTLRL